MAVKLKLNNMFLTVIHIAYLYCLFALLMLNMCFALYEDQVGLFDWRQQYIGNTKHVYFEQSTHSKRVFTTTEENVLAALNARTGQIMWRKVFERKDGMIESLLHSSNLLVTVSASGRTARSWDPNKGHLIWESISQKKHNINLKLQDEKLSKILKGHKSILLDEEDVGGIVISSSASVRMISQSDGSDIWEYVVDDSDSYLMGIAKIPDRIILFVLKLDGENFTLNIRHLEMENGKLVDEVTLLEVPWLAQEDTTCDLISNRFFVCLIQKEFKIMVNDFTVKSELFHDTSLLELASVTTLSQIYSMSLKALSDGSDKFLVHLSREHLILASINDSSGSISLLRQIRKSGFYSEVYLSKQRFVFEVFKDIVDGAENLQINVYKADEKFTAYRKLETRIALGAHSGMGVPVHGTVYAYSKRNDINYRIVVNFEDYSLSLIQNMGNHVGKVLWVRNEALSGVTFTRMIELPPSTSASKLELLHAEFAAVSNSGVLTMFINRVKSQIRQIQAYMENLKKQQQRYLDVNVHHNKEEKKTEILARDQFNIIKIALFMTKSRKLFALNTVNGEIVWSQFLRQINPHNVEKHVTIIEQRTTAHFPLPPQCFLIARLSKEADSVHKTAIYTFNPLNGLGLESPISVHPFEVLQVAELPIEDEKSLKVIWIIDTEHKLHIFPNSSQTIEKALEHLDKMYVYLVNTTVNTFVGYKVKYVKSTFMLYEVWRVNIPMEQKIEKLKKKRNDEVVHSVGRVLGDHTVMYKYLNPNLLGFMTVHGTGVKGAVFVYIVDAVTGHIVYQARHKGSDAPFDLILSEHWLVYSYYNSKGRRIEISVVEFYEGYEEKNNTAFSSLDPIGPPMVLSQGYLLPVGGISSITTTCTERGITNKNILIGLENGYVYSIPKNFLDPRRSFKQTPMLQEEGVPQYMPELPLMAQGYINYNQTVQRIRGIHTSAAGLESTSLVLVYGLDLYYTRVTPSKMFDVLKEDFDYIFISGVLSLLVMTSVICSKLASMRALKLAWQ